MFTALEKIDFSRFRGSLQRAHEEAFWWFKKNGGGGLAYPRLTGKLRSQKVRKCLFWFEADASFWGYRKGSVVRRARDLAAVMTEAGCEIREVTVKDPGEIIWKDTIQVLAHYSSDKVPRAF